GSVAPGQNPLAHGLIDRAVINLAGSTGLFTRRVASIRSLRRHGYLPRGHLTAYRPVERCARAATDLRTGYRRCNFATSYPHGRTYRAATVQLRYHLVKRSRLCGRERHLEVCTQSGRVCILPGILRPPARRRVHATPASSAPL